MVNFSGMEPRVEWVREELARARVVLEEKRREVEDAEKRVAVLEERVGALEKVEVKVQVEVEEQVVEVGAVKRCDGGDPRASPPLWPPKPLPVGGEERLLLEKQVEVEVEEKVEVEEVAAVKEQEASDMVPLLDRPLLVEAPRGKLPSEADTISLIYHQAKTRNFGTFKGFQGKTKIQSN